MEEVLVMVPVVLVCPGRPVPAGPACWKCLQGSVGPRLRQGATETHNQSHPGCVGQAGRPGVSFKRCRAESSRGQGLRKTWLWCSLPSCDLTSPRCSQGKDSWFTLVWGWRVKHYRRFLYGRIETGLAWSAGLAQQQQPRLLQPPRTCAGPPQLALTAGTGPPASPPAFPLAARACLLTAPILPFNSITAIKVP